MLSDSSLPLLGAAAAVGATMGLGFYLATKSGAKVTPMVQLDSQTQVLPDGARILKGAKEGKYAEQMFEDTTTLYEAMRRGAKESKGGECVGIRKLQADGTRPFVWTSYEQVISRSENLAAGFVSLGIEPGQDSLIGLYSKNRPEWIITEQACYHYSMVVVPLYDTLGPDACHFIINQAQMAIVVCDESKKAESLLQSDEPCPALKYMAVMEPPSDSLLAAAKRHNLTVLTLEEIEKKGMEMEKKPIAVPPSPSTISTVCYTSGTTGTPKGVILTHGNVVADTATLSYFKHAAISGDDVMISFLPLAHMFERVLEAACFTMGAKIGFYSGDVRQLTDDIKELRPTVVPAVPRVLNRIYDKVTGEVGKSGVKRMLFDWALGSKSKELQRSVVRNNGVWDKVVFKKVREGMGGRVRLLVTGSAPCADAVLTFIRAALGCIVVEGYGQTECVAAATITIEGDHTPGHVGVPVPCCEVRLADVAEMNYFSSEDKGEVCVRGANVFKSYYKDPAKTAEALDSDGWLHTGDIGMWTPAGTLKIIDRKKHIFKLAQGEYVAPEKIEAIYSSSRFVAQVFVYGESLKSSLVGVIVPDSEVLEKEAKKHSKGDKSLAELCQDDEVCKWVLDDMTKVGKAKGLFSFEQVKAVYLCPDLFSIENNLLTPTLKSKRPQLKEYFEKQIGYMYSRLD